MRSIPFLILLILVIPLTKLIVGKSYGSSATIVPLDDIIQALTGVQSNLYAAAVTDLPVSSYEIKVAYSDLTIPTGGEIPTGEQYGVVVSKSNPELTRAINKALADIKADGTMAELQRKWFGKEV